MSTAIASGSQPLAAPSIEDAASARARRLIAGGLVVCGALALLLPWFRSFFGLTTDGWFFFFAHRLLLGHVPYRDFHLFAPPLHVFELAALIRLFGEHLLAAHVLGLLQRVTLALVLYRWLAAVYATEVAVVASLAGVALFTGDIADTVFFYHQDSAFWGLAAGAAAALCLRRSEQGAARAALFAAAASGLLAGLCLIDKQTVGLGVSAALPTMLALAARPRAPQRVRSLLAAWTGAWALPVAAVALWLLAHQALRPFLDQVFLGGTASKGSLGTILTRALGRELPADVYGSEIALALVVLAGIGALAVAARRAPAASGSAPDGRWAAPLVGLAALLAILIGNAMPTGHREPRLVAVYVALFGSLGLGLALGWPLLRRRATSERNRQRLLLASLGFTMAYMYSLSWPAWEAMTMPGAALLLCEVWTHARARWPWARHLVTAVGCWLLLLAAGAKAAVPFAWGEWVEPPLERATASSEAPLLRGFALSPTTASFVDTLARLVREYSRPEDPVFVFPHLPAVYLLAEREPPTFGYVHWFDVAPDALARRDAETLRRVRPAVLVDYEISRPEWRLNELLFRGNKPSGQRDLVAALRELGASPDYRLVARLAAPGTGSPVLVWARTTAAATAANGTP